MRVASRFAIAVHVLSILGQELGGDNRSEWIAGSVGVNPVIIRSILGRLRRAGLVHTRRGVVGAILARPLEQITLLDIYRAVEDDGEIFGIHPHPNAKCPVGAAIQGTLERVFHEAREAMESRLAATTMDQIIEDMNTKATAVTAQDATAAV